MTSVTEGQKAPAFKGKDQNGNTVSLSDFKGQKVVLYFYPEDGTPTCTTQACNLRDNFGLLKNEGFEVIGVSPDDVSKHKKFETKYELPLKRKRDLRTRSKSTISMQSFLFIEISLVIYHIKIK